MLHVLVVLDLITCLKMYEHVKGISRSRKSKKDGQYNGKKKKSKGTNNDLQNNTEN